MNAFPGYPSSSPSSSHLELVDGTSLILLLFYQQLVLLFCRLELRSPDFRLHILELPVIFPAIIDLMSRGEQLHFQSAIGWLIQRYEAGKCFSRHI